MTDDKAEEGRLHLKLSPILAGRIRKYAEDHGMKLSAVIKKAFELLEDFHEGLVVTAGKVGDDDY